jgi:hypothetical protein
MSILLEAFPDGKSRLTYIGGSTEMANIKPLAYAL